MSEVMAVPIGEVVGQITSVRPVHEIIYRIVLEYGEAMERLAALSGE
jgi:hypothetical protein